MTNAVYAAMTDFYQRYVEMCKENNYQPSQPFDAEWDSVCFTDEERIIDGESQRCWLPVKRSEKINFDNIESAMSIQLDPQLAAFFGTYLSDHIPVKLNDENITLVQVWNDEDFHGLQENIIAHLMMKKRLKQSPTLFIASSEDDMQIIAIDNVTGEVVREYLGKGVVDVLAPDVASFMGMLTPVLEG